MTNRMERPERPDRCLLCEARLKNPVCQMSPTAVARVSAVSVVTSFRPGQMIFGQGDRAGSVYLVRAGRLKVVHEHPDGTQQVLRVAGPGELLGLANRIDGIHVASAVARTTGSVCILRNSDIERILADGGEFALAWAHLLMDEVRRARESVFHHGPHPAAVRLARYLATETVRHLPNGAAPAAPPREVTPPSLPLTHADIGGLLSIAQETATRLLRDLEEQGVLRLGRGRIEVLDLDRLQALGGFPGTEGGFENA